MPANDEIFKYWTGDPTREKKVVDFVVGTRDAIKSARRLREEVWLECYNIYRQIHQHQAYNGRAQIYLPSGFVSVETIAPRLILGLMGQMPYLKVVPRKNATQERARKISSLLSLQAEQAELFWQMLNFIKQMGIYGKGRGKFYWDRKLKKVMRKGLVPAKRINPQTQQEEVYAEYGGVPSEEFKFDGPRFRTVDPFRFFEDPDAASISEGTGCIERIVKRESALRDFEKMGYYGNMQDLDRYASSGQELYSAQEVQRMAATGINTQGMYDMEKKYDVSEYWGLYDLNGDGEKEECKITIVGDRRLICIEENQFWFNEKPYLDCPYIPIGQESDGIGILEPVRSLIYEQNDTHNQIMDNKTLLLNCMYLMDENAGIRVSDLKMRPGGIIRARNMKGLEALRPPDFTTAGYSAFSLMERIIKESTGATNPQIGVSSSGEQTATEISSLISEGNVRNKLVLKLLEERVIKPLARYWYSMNEQLMNRTNYMQVVENGNPLDLVINPDDIYGDYDFEPQGAIQMQAESVKNQQKIAFFNIAAKFAPQVIPLLLTQIWKDMDQRGGEELERVLLGNPQFTTGLTPPGPLPTPTNITTPGQALAQPTNMGR